MNCIYRKAIAGLFAAALLVSAGCGEVDSDSSADGPDKSGQTESGTGGSQQVD